MTQANELIESLSEEEIAMYTADPETEPHIVIGKDRRIIVPDELKRIAIQYDHNIETVTFDCPRYWDNHDLSQMVIYINYKLPNNTLGSYAATNVIIDGTDENVIHFDWTISRNVTQYNGKISFLVCAKRVEESYEYVHNHWNSELNQEMFISEGLECEESIAEEYPDVLTGILTRLNQLENDLGTTKPTIHEYIGFYTTDSGMSCDVSSDGLTALYTSPNKQKIGDILIYGFGLVTKEDYDLYICVETPAILDGLYTATYKKIANQGELVKKATVHVYDSNMDYTDGTSFVEDEESAYRAQYRTTDNIRVGDDVVFIHQDGSNTLWRIVEIGYEVDDFYDTKTYIGYLDMVIGGTFYQNVILEAISDLQTQIGDVETALDGIIAIQNTLMGGDAV